MVISFLDPNITVTESEQMFELCVVKEGIHFSPIDVTISLCEPQSPVGRPLQVASGMTSVPVCLFTSLIQFYNNHFI